MYCMTVPPDSVPSYLGSYLHLPLFQGMSESQLLMQALTVGGDELQKFLQAHPDMRAAIPVLLDGLRNLKTSAPAKR